MDWISWAAASIIVKLYILSSDLASLYILSFLGVVGVRTWLDRKVRYLLFGKRKNSTWFWSVVYLSVQSPQVGFENNYLGLLYKVSCFTFLYLRRVRLRLFL